MPSFAPDRTTRSLPHLGLRLALLLRLDHHGQKAWAAAAADPVKARQLRDAGVPCPATEDACRPWIDVLIQPGAPERAELNVWMQSLLGDEGQRWRNRALWAAALSLQGPTVAVLLKAGAQGVPRAGLHETDGQREGLTLPLLAQLLRANPPTRKAAPSEADVMETVAHWVSAEPGALAQALAALTEAGCPLRPFEPGNLQWLGAMGASFSGIHARPWFDALLPAAHAPLPCSRSASSEQSEGYLHIQQESVRTLFGLGAPADVRWPNGDTLLHRLLRFWPHRATPCTEGLLSWFGFLRQHGADPHALLPSGDTLLHTAFRHENGVFFPRALVDMIVALRPADLSTPAADGATPLSLLEGQIQGGTTAGGGAMSAALKIRAGAAQAHLTRLRHVVPVTGTARPRV